MGLTETAQPCVFVEGFPGVEDSHLELRPSLSFISLAENLFSLRCVWSLGGSRFDTLPRGTPENGWSMEQIFMRC